MDYFLRISVDLSVRNFGGVKIKTTNKLFKVSSPCQNHLLLISYWSDPCNSKKLLRHWDQPCSLGTLFCNTRATPSTREIMMLSWTDKCTTNGLSWQPDLMNMDLICRLSGKRLDEWLSLSTKFPRWDRFTEVRSVIRALCKWLNCRLYQEL